jgi:hypothetical protein
MPIPWHVTRSVDGVLWWERVYDDYTVWVRIEDGRIVAASTASFDGKPERWLFWGWADA